MTKFAIYSLGCKISQYDAAILRRELESRGFKIDFKNPALVIVNTCAVTKAAISKDRQLINRLRRDFPGAYLVVMGCWPEAYSEEKTNGDNDRILFWGVGRRGELIDKIINFFPPAVKNKRIGSGLLADYDRTRYFIKIGDGCNQFCSYCIIPYARGRLKSRPGKEIIAEIRKATAGGYREIVLSGIHLGRYGEDFAPGNANAKNLVGLLQDILKIKNVGRLRLSSIEINEVDDELIALMKTNRLICRHLHISLQSGSDKILKAMNRPYTASYFKKRIEKLRLAMPEIAISTDIIVGFPGETASDFKETFNFAKKINFSKIHTFSFSAHEKTPAFKLTPKISAAEIKKRSAVLRELSTQLESNYKKKILRLYRGAKLPVVVENPRRSGYQGKTEFHFDLPVPPKLLPRSEAGRQKIIGRIIDVPV